MADNDTLLAYLVPKLTSQVENAATESLGYILNRSDGAMQALNDLLREGGLDIEPITRVETQVSYEDGSIPDMTGYDGRDAMRLLVEAKFWAALLGGQASGYGRLFDQSGPATLLFISPELRIPTLWVEIERQMASVSRLEAVDSGPGGRRVRVSWLEPSDTELQLVLISWSRMLDRMEILADDETVKSDIWQLRGLAQLEDAQAFLPIHSEELSPSRGRRVVWYKQLVDDVVGARGVREKWMDVDGLRVTPQWYGYGRYFHFTGAKGDFWFGINHDKWATSGDTPLWLLIGSYGIEEVRDVIGKALNVQVESRWVPIYPKPGVEYHDVLDDVVSQLKKIGELLRSIPI